MGLGLLSAFVNPYDRLEGKKGMFENALNSQRSSTPSVEFFKMTD